MRAARRHLEPAAEAEATGTSIGTYWASAYAGVVLVLVLALLAVGALWVQAERGLVFAHVTAESSALADELADRAAAVRGQVERWTTDPAIAAALADGRPAVLAAKEQELARLIPGALGLRLFTARDLEPGGRAADELSYAGLDMVRAVMADGQVAALEAHRVRQPDEHLAIAGPVRLAAGGGAQDVLGVVHLKLPLAMLPARDAPADAARYLFLQPVGDAPVALAAQGDRSTPDAAPTYRAPVPGTRLLLAAWVEPRGLFSGTRLPWVGGILLGAAVASALVLWLAYSALRRALEADLNGVTGLVEDGLQRRPARPLRNRLADLAPTLETVRRLVREMPAARPLPAHPSGNVAALAAGADHDAEKGDTGDLDFEGTLDLSEPGAPGGGAGPAAPATVGPVFETISTVPDAIFRAYDIRGLLGGEINEAVMRMLGLAVGSAARDLGSETVIVGRDQRPSGEGLCRALSAGLLRAGVDVVDLGILPTPLVYFACGLRHGASAAIVTASHNPAEYNGLKVVLAGASATDQQIAALRERVRHSDFRQGEGELHTEPESVIDTYIEAVEGDVALARGMSLVIDCGHATAGLVAPRLFRALGCSVAELDCELDPALADQHMPDPAQPQNLYALGDAVRSAGADLGLGFDADGDRLGVVDSEGQFIAIDRVLMLLAADLLARRPGSDIVYDVKCSHHLGAEILRHGGRPVMWKSGHAFLKQKARETGAPLAGELSGHILFGERWNGFDDAFYAAARLLEVLALDPRPSHQVFAALPSSISTPELFAPLPPGEESGVMAAVLAMADRLEGVDVNTIDGLRAEFDQGWGLVRASNTQSGLVFRFEADDRVSLEKIQDLFRRMMDLAAPRLELPF